MVRTADGVVRAAAELGEAAPVVTAGKVAVHGDVSPARDEAILQINS